MSGSAIQLRLINAAGRRLDCIWAVARAVGEVSIPLPVGGLSRETPIVGWQSGRWTLHNTTANLCLHLNGQPLGPHDSSPLALGDEIDALDLAPDAEVGLSIESGRLVVAAPTRRRYSLDELLAQCKPSSRRARKDRDWQTGRAVGRELI